MTMSGLEIVVQSLIFFNTGEYQKYNTAYYIPRNYTTVDGKDFENFWALRMSRLTRDLHYDGVKHNYAIFQDVLAKIK